MYFAKLQSFSIFCHVAYLPRLVSLPRVESQRFADGFAVPLLLLLPLMSGPARADYDGGLFPYRFLVVIATTTTTIE